MSLIYSALNKLEPGADAQSEAPSIGVRPAAVMATQKTGLPRWVVWAIFGSVVAVLLGWWSMHWLKAQFAAVQISASVPAPMPQASAPFVPARLAASPVPTLTPVLQTPAPPQALDAAIENPLKALKVEKAAAPLGTVSAKTRLKSRPTPREVAPAQLLPTSDEIHPEETERLVRAITLAINSGKTAEAESLLTQLGERLPAESITLLRLRAWQNMQNGDQVKALALYRQIVQRLPEDEPASINLALLYWKAGQLDEARRLIAALAQRHPESSTLERYSHEFGALQ